jgi:2-keto-3-deoxy-L-rhamnonate aldolase RhmA
MLKEKLRKKELTLGSWITIPHPSIAEILASAGYDWLVIDLEHTIISIAEAGELIRVIDLCGVAPLVRLTSNQPDQIKRVMDAGAHGIVVPMVCSVEDAKKAIAATRYAPHGIRGVGLARAQKFGPGFTDYLQWQKDGPVVIVQIEHKDALENLEEIFSEPGVDGFIIGPYDLSCSMGMPGEFERLEFKEAINHILKTGLRMNFPAGIHIVEPDQKQLRQVISEGYSFIGYSVDFRILDDSSRKGILVARE